MAELIGRSSLARVTETEHPARMASTEPVRAHNAVVPAVARDVDQIRNLAVATGMFAADDLGGIDEMLSGYLDGSLAAHRWLVAKDSTGGIAGAAYYAPEPFADRVWNLYFLAVNPQKQRGGVGALMVTTVEQSLREVGEEMARVLIVETSSTGPYQGARSFYRLHGFEQEARIREYYGPADDKIVFWKFLVGV